MKLDVHRQLSEIEAAQGTGYGKLVQKLLAIAFLDAGATRVTERSTQGIDLEVEIEGGRRLALEVKTTRTEVKLGAKDVQGLASRQEEGYEAYVAALGPRLLDDWVFARFHEGEIVPGGSYLPLHLRAWRDRGLEAVVAETFPAAVRTHGRRAAEGGQGALDDVLRGHPAFHPA